MTWAEIKKAAEEAGVKDNDDIWVIQCESEYGAKTFHKMMLGHSIKLTEDFSEEGERKMSSGCSI